MHHLALALALMSGPSQVDLDNVERSFDERLKKTMDSPLQLMDYTNSVYIPGYGVVLTARVELVLTAGTSAFHPKVTQAEKDQTVQANAKKLPELKRTMMELLSNTKEFEKLPQNEQVTLSVKIFCKPGYPRTGLPDRVVMTMQNKQIRELN